MKNPLVSALIAVYNGGPTIAQALDSVAAQTYPHLEIICVEDGSTDTTWTTIQSWQQNHPHLPMTILRNPKNLGLANSLNRGIAAANGTYIARIDADDTWIPDKITKQITFLSANPKYGMIGSFYINERDHEQRRVRLPITDSAIKQSMFQRNPFGHSCIVVKKSLLQEVEGYNGQLREDRDLWFRLLPRTHFHNLPEFLVMRNISTSHFTSSKELRRNIRTVHTYIKKYHQPITTYIWLLEPIAVYLYHSLKKHAIH